jgi:hypothetical protein
MKKAILFCLCLLAGCGAPRLSEEEMAVVEDVVSEFEALREEYAELAGFDERLERGRNFVSYSVKLGEGLESPLVSRDYFWFKVSLVEKPVEALDAHRPVLSYFLPGHGKYLKLRVVTTNAELAARLIGVFQETAIKHGGTDPRYDPSALSGHGGPGRRRRMGPIVRP